MSRSSNEEVQENGFVTYSDGERSTCRDMSREETQRLQRDPEQLRQMRVITQRERDEVLGRRQTEAVLEATSLKIILRSTAQLDGFPDAKAAFIRAAAAWEAQIKNPISIIIDVDYGPTRFGQAYPSGVLGSTSTPSYRVGYDTLRNSLSQSATSAAETSLYNALPTSSVNTDIGAIGNASVTSPLMRALGLLAVDAATSDPAPAIGFNSAFNFDFDPTDGIAAGKTDFDAVAVHEMGHALGFVSNVGLFEISPTSTRALTVWDIFRFRPGTTMATFTAAARVLSTGGEQRFYDGHPELATSTGNPYGSGGDGRQASHWKADEQSGVYIGIMDPTLSSGVRKTMSSNDLQMLETVGYTISGTVTPPPPACTYSLSATTASAAITGGPGSVGVTSSSSTCAWSATSTASWISVTTGANGTGNGTVSYSVQPNSGSSRSGTITIAGQTFTVNQSGCSFTLSYSTNSFPSNSSTGSVIVTASGGTCSWAAVSNNSWITITGGAAGTGNGMVSYTLEANTSAASRTGSLTIAGRVFTITQAAPACTYTVGSFNTNFPARGGSVSIPVTTGSSCSWQAIENVSWLSFSPGSTVSGSRSVTLNVSNKNTVRSRSATVTIAGVTFTITQSGR
ncbi:MAG: NF038122 family metalloprotease [Acidobacteria bacterium]|nr:NF038122 family metalloprotease [Acidobacteriota bacterium]